MGEPVSSRRRPLFHRYQSTQDWGRGGARFLDYVPATTGAVDDRLIRLIMFAVHQLACNTRCGRRIPRDAEILRCKEFHSFLVFFCRIRKGAGGEGKIRKPAGGDDRFVRRRNRYCSGLGANGFRQRDAVFDRRPRQL